MSDKGKKYIFTQPEVRYAFLTNPFVPDEGYSRNA
jgi:hypothetical protein